MADKHESTELDIARQARAAARERVTERIAGPNLDRNGKEKGLVAPTPAERPKNAAALKNEYGNGREKSVEQIEREIVGDSIRLTGKVKAMTAAKGNVGQKREALRMSPNLSIPVAQNMRASNKDGATSFHFKYEAISKTLGEKVSAGGTVTRRNAGRDHSKYLERASAVAMGDGIADRATLLDADRDAAASLAGAAAGGLYIEREVALAHSENGVAAIYSNISKDNAAERHRFWELVEKYETKPKPDHLKIVTGRAPEFWKAVREDSRCPDQVALAIAEADPSKPYRVRTDDNETMRRIMATHGWVPPAPRGPNETKAEKEERERLDAINAKGAHCKDGRGGRVQNRIVGELPYEVTHEQRIRILRRFAAEFDKKKLPYVAVMHAPDHANNDKNWHFHLAYYERPCRRFTGEVADHLEEKPVGKTFRQEAQYQIRKDALESGELAPFVGEWDFAVPVTYKKTVSRNTIVSHPFAQDKDRECNHEDWPQVLRAKLADYTNDELHIAGVARRVDPRRFVEMGIDKQAEDHLGSRSAQMESLGIATPRGVENEHRQWRFTLDRIAKQFNTDERQTSNEERRLRQDLEAGRLDAAAKADVRRMITNLSEAQSHANEMKAIADELKEHLERARSRATKVKETCRRHLDAIERGTANKRQTDNRTNYRARLVEAADHLMGLGVTMASEILHERRTREKAERLTAEATNMRKAIFERLDVEIAAIMASPATKDRIRAAAAPMVKDVPTDGAAPMLDRGPPAHTAEQHEFERFIKNLVDGNRRLETEGLYIVPVDPTVEEGRIVTARNYADLQPRLRRLKAVQDGHIERLVLYIANNPKAIEFVPAKEGDTKIVYRLRTADGALQHTFKSFGADDQVKTAIGKILRGAIIGPGGKTASLPAAGAEHAAAGLRKAQESGEANGVAVIQTNDTDVAPKPLSRPDVMRRIDDIAGAGTPILTANREGRPVFRISDEDMRGLGVSGRDLEAVAVQTRLCAIHEQQRREIRRLVGFVKRNPRRVETQGGTGLSGGRPIVRLRQGAPLELRALSDRYESHPEAQEHLREALATVLKDAGDGITDWKAEGAPATNGGRDVGDLQMEPFTAATQAMPSRPQESDTSIANTKGVEIVEEAALPAFPAAKQGVVPRNENTSPRTNKKVDLTADTGSAAKVNPDRIEKGLIGETTPMEASRRTASDDNVNLKRRSAARMETPSTDAPMVAQSAETRVMPLDAEDRAELLRPRKIGNAGEVVAPELDVKANGSFQKVSEPSRMSRGAHPKIDAWIDAFEARDHDARQMAALALKNDGKAFKVALGALDNSTQVMIRSDWEALQARDRAEIAAEAERRRSSHDIFG